MAVAPSLKAATTAVADKDKGNSADNDEPPSPNLSPQSVADAQTRRDPRGDSPDNGDPLQPRDDAAHDVANENAAERDIPMSPTHSIAEPDEGGQDEDALAMFESSSSDESL